MNKEPTTEELERKLQSLISEKGELEEKLSQVKEWESRLRSLLGGFHSHGEIEITKLQIRDSRFPVFYDGGWAKRRIVSIDDKWITLRDDRSEESDVKRYKRETGIREKKRTDYDKIDVERAVSIWNEHTAKQQDNQRKDNHETAAEVQ